ncbi:hypothetical protein J1N35_022528 [Gossypium stocksii]|uniref:Uncharacterized protein n=1 Tax=Gossypium stocksii TaxID=47602 RepID=A0A9D3VI56_9ROSI|nr:hypothetical protein J1N35_022528 [Gossypium stocksii]
MPLHPLHIPHIPTPQSFLYNPHSALTTLPPSFQSPNLASIPPPLLSPNGSTPPHISPLYSPHNPPPFPTLPLFDYPNITTTNGCGGNKEMPKKIMNSTQNVEREYTTFIQSYHIQ